MSTQGFTRNHKDCSNASGFQFEFFCDKCGNGHRSEFKRNNIGLVASLAKAAGSLLGGSASRAARGADALNRALRGPAWDNAFRDAVQQCKPLFRQCTICGKWVCPQVCWNHDRGLCEDCAPNLGEHAARIQAQVALQQAEKRAAQGDQLRGFDISSEARAVPLSTACPQCQAPQPDGAKFCSNCGAGVAVEAPSKKFCNQCGGGLAAGVKFCGNCGATV